MAAAVLHLLALKSFVQIAVVHYILQAASERRSWTLQVESCSIEPAADFALQLRFRFLPFLCVFSLKKTSDYAVLLI